MDAGAKGNKGRVRPTHALAVGALSLVVVFSLGSLMTSGRSSTVTSYGSYGGAALAPVHTGAGHGDVGARLTAYEGKMADFMSQMASVRQEVADVANTVANLEQAVADGGGLRYVLRPNPISAVTRSSYPSQQAQPTPPKPPLDAAAPWCASVTQAGSARGSYGWVRNSQFRLPPGILTCGFCVCQLGVKPTTRTLAHRFATTDFHSAVYQGGSRTICQRRRTGSDHARHCRAVPMWVVPFTRWSHHHPPPVTPTTPRTHTPSATTPGGTRGGRRSSARRHRLCE